MGALQSMPNCGRAPYRLPGRNIQKRRTAGAPSRVMVTELVLVAGSVLARRKPIVPADRLGVGKAMGSVKGGHQWPACSLPTLWQLHDWMSPNRRSGVVDEGRYNRATRCW
jgi:hypothetical protein